ncbi:MAG: hypothetical protein QM820_20325 [Minicystis sp.]
MGWREICRSDEYRGRWVALDNVRYDPMTSRPLEADVVDADEDLADLCARMRAADRTACAILHCDEDEVYRPVMARSSSSHPRAAHR